MIKDKLIVSAISLGFIFLSVYSWFPTPGIEDIVRTALGVALCVCLYLGYAWSRWVLGVLSLVASVFSIIVFAAQSASEGMNSVIFLIPVFLYYGFASFFLLNPLLLKSHFKTGAA